MARRAGLQWVDVQTLVSVLERPTRERKGGQASLPRARLTSDRSRRYDAARSRQLSSEVEGLLQLQVQAERVVEVRHCLGWGPSQDRAQPLDCDRTDLLGLGFGVHAQAGGGCR